MTLLELQKILGARIEKVQDGTLTDEQREAEVKTSDIIARLAKQMINNADIILRTDKLRETQGNKITAISKVVGYAEESLQ